jgi:signal transduction histidine kinase
LTTRRSRVNPPIPDNLRGALLNDFRMRDRPSRAKSIRAERGDVARRLESGVHPRLTDERGTARESASRPYAEVTSLLCTGLDYRMSLARATEVLAKLLGGGCVVDLDGDPPMQIVEVPHLDIARVVGTVAPFVEAVVATGVAMLPDSALAERAARALGVAEIACLPIRGIGETIGALTILRSGNDGVPQLDDRDLEDLARCMAAVVENGRMHERVVEGLRIRDEILSIVSHDLKNPLAVILLSASRMLARSSLDTAEGRHADTIKRSANRMRRLVSDLLDTAAIESGSLRIEAAPCSINVLVREAIHAALGAAGAAGVTVEAELDELPPVLADSERVLQILGNLLANAIKFTRPGGRIVVRGEAYVDRVAIHVEDTGVGISAAELGNVFDRFWQARRSYRSGTGLGLAICKSLVERSGGTISVTSTVGVGTTMSFTLPRSAGGTVEAI